MGLYRGEILRPSRLTNGHRYRALCRALCSEVDPEIARDPCRSSLVAAAGRIISGQELLNGAPQSRHPRALSRPRLRPHLNNTAFC
ncbi:hypothetical protein EVAR_5900_1 [Eumeta japonica]|uniref:Uncharacterized protein n=1 Tax=Eumeta variegata TaxID=151549 RepID=A0A4C1TF42_EUMVA|nr:hypothetical protein EVAR_5900_1 [Eumeta japonica]